MYGNAIARKAAIADRLGPRLLAVRRDREQHEVGQRSPATSVIRGMAEGPRQRHLALRAALLAALPGPGLPDRSPAAASHLPQPVTGSGARHCAAGCGTWVAVIGQARALLPHDRGPLAKDTRRRSGC
jgi:hypothetical protein